MAAFTLTQSAEDPGIFLVMGPEGMPVPTVNEFLLHMSHCGRSAYTLRSYAHGLAHFFDWLHTSGLHVDDVTPQAVEAYMTFFSTEAKGGACPSNPYKGIVNFMRMAELAPPDLKRRGHLGRGRITIVRKTHQRKNHEVDNTVATTTYDGGVTNMVNVKVTGTQQHPMLLRTVYYVCIGWWAGYFWASLAYGLCLTILGIPLGIIMLKSLPAVLTLRKN